MEYTLYELIRDIDTVVDYMLPDEEADFEQSEREGNDTERHIVHTLRRLNEAIEPPKEMF